MLILASLRSSDLAPNLLVGEGVTIADDVEIGANVVIHDGVRVASGANIQHGAVLGKVSTYRRGSAEPPPVAAVTEIGAGVIVGCYAIVGTGVELAPHAFVADHSVVRSGVRVGSDGMLGFACGLGTDVVVGDRVRMQAHGVAGRNAVIESDCFMGPGVHVLTGRTMGSPAGEAPTTLRRGCQIGSGAKILPGVEIGEEAVVGANAVVNRDVAAGALVKGVPARSG